MKFTKEEKELVEKLNAALDDALLEAKKSKTTLNRILKKLKAFSEKVRQEGEENPLRDAARGRI